MWLRLGLSDCFSSFYFLRLGNFLLVARTLSYMTGFTVQLSTVGICLSSAGWFVEGALDASSCIPMNLFFFPPETDLLCNKCLGVCFQIRLGTQQDRRGLRPSRPHTTEELWWAQGMIWQTRSPSTSLTVFVSPVCVSGHHPGVRHHRWEVLRKHPKLDEEHPGGEAIFFLGHYKSEFKNQIFLNFTFLWDEK